MWSIGFFGYFQFFLLFEQWVFCNENRIKYGAVLSNCSLFFEVDSEVGVVVEGREEKRERGKEEGKRGRRKKRKEEGGGR